MTTMKLKLIETGIYQIITILEVNSGWSSDRRVRWTLTGADVIGGRNPPTTKMKP